jgi:ribokinase
METPRITVVGSINVDMTVFSSRLPRPGETVSGGRFVQAGGGKGANQAAAITTEREGAQPSLPLRRDIKQRMKSYKLEE